MKKISLEHSIRNIVIESVGNVNDLKTSRAPKAVFNQSVQIEPPTGEEHPGRNAMNVANRRKAAKQSDSLTRQTFAEDLKDVFRGLENQGSSARNPGGGAVDPSKIFKPASPDILLQQQKKNTPQTSNTPPAAVPTTPPAPSNPPAAEAPPVRRVPGSTPTLQSDTFREGYTSLEHSIRNIFESGLKGGKAKGKSGEVKGGDSGKAPDEGKIKDSGTPEAQPKDYDTFGKDIDQPPAGKFEKQGQPKADETLPKDEARPKEETPPKDEAPPKDDAKPKDETPPKDDAKPKDDTAKAEEEARAKAEEEARAKAEEEAKSKGDVKGLAGAAGLGALAGAALAGGGSGGGVSGKDAGTTSVFTHLHGTRPRMIHHDDFIHNRASAKQITKRIIAAEETKMENGQERKKIEYVGRGKLDAKTTLGRQAAYKTNVIDEASGVKSSKASKIKSIVLDKKEENLGINPAVETEPRLKPLHMAEAETPKQRSSIPGVPELADTFTGKTDEIRNSIEAAGKEALGNDPEAIEKVRGVGKTVKKGVEGVESGLTSVAEPIQRGVQSAADKTGKIIAGPNYKFKPEDPKSQDFQDRENALYGTAVGGAALAGAGAAARKGSEVLTGVKRPNPNWAERWGVRAGKAGVYGALGNSLLQDPSKNETEEGRSLGTNAAFAADTAIRGDIGQGALKNPNANILQRAGGRVMQGLNIARKLGIVGLIGHSLLPKPADSDNQAPSDSVNRSGRGDRMLNPTPLKRQQ